MCMSFPNEWNIPSVQLLPELTKLKGKTYSCGNDCVFFRNIIVISKQYVFPPSAPFTPITRIMHIFECSAQADIKCTVHYLYMPVLYIVWLWWRISPDWWDEVYDSNPVTDKHPYYRLIRLCIKMVCVDQLSAEALLVHTSSRSACARVCVSVCFKWLRWRPSISSSASSVSNRRSRWGHMALIIAMINSQTRLDHRWEPEGWLFTR